MRITRLKIWITSVIAAASLASCTKVIDLKLGNDSGKLVIEGNLTDVSGPQYIKLSRNVPFTSTNTYPPVSGARVYITDQAGTQYQFTEGPAGTYVYPGMAGFPGSAYLMTVKTSNNIYTATSEMPALVHLDSITSKPAPFSNGNNKREITVHFQDPPGVANQYRFIMYVNNVQVNAIFAFNDDFTDGRYANLDLFENQTDIYPGDIVRVEMQCVDKPVYTYWFTLMQQQTFGGPDAGVAPSNPPTNITPSCLGYFSAHTTETQSLIVK